MSRVVSNFPPGHQRRPRTHGRELARALSKLGFCSRAQARELVAAGRVKVDGIVRRDPNWQVDLKRDRFEVDQASVQNARRVYVMLNKPRGLVTTASDEKGRRTVFACFAGADLPFIAPVGRLDKASEGLLLFTNDTQWAAGITDPASHVEKTYHVHLDCVVDQELLRRMEAGVVSGRELLKAKKAAPLRHGTHTSWVEIVLDEGKNRHIRRLLVALHINATRLMRVALGDLRLGNLKKGEFRVLTQEEIARLR